MYVCICVRMHIYQLKCTRERTILQVSYTTALELLKGFGEIKEVGPSLGSFSVSAQMLLALIKVRQRILENVGAHLRAHVSIHSVDIHSSHAVVTCSK
jgi:hypothetical protein